MKFIELRLSSHFPIFRYFCSYKFINKKTENVNKTSRADFRMAPNVFRQQKTYSAVVQDIWDASPSIKILRLYVEEKGFYFKAGQWVDFYVPGIEEVTGYSMTSPPYEAKEKGLLELAVKYGKFPPTHWLHTKCHAGDEVQIRVGGDFFYDPLSNRQEAESDLLLVGGGVGINPLVSILCEYRHLINSVNLENNENIHPGKVLLLYSAKTEDELVFRDTFTMMEIENPLLTCQYFVTREGSQQKQGIKNSRIDKESIRDSVEKLQRDKTLCYICGPSNMTDVVADWLWNLGVKKKNIRYEKWW